MNCLILSSKLTIFLLFFCFTALFANDESDIKDFLISIKTHEDIKRKINYKNLLGYNSFLSKERVTLFCSSLNLSYEDVKSSLNEDFPNEAKYSAFLENKYFKDFEKKIDLNIFKLPCEIKKLGSGEILILFDEGKKGLKIPVLLIYENIEYKFDLRTFVQLAAISKFNKLRHADYMNDLDLLATFDHYHHFNRELDYTYLLEIFKRFKLTEDQTILYGLIYYGSYFTSVLKSNGARLQDKSVKLEAKEAKLIAAQLHFSLNKFKERKIEEINEAYSIAEEIIKTMTAEEKVIYHIEKVNK